MNGWLKQVIIARLQAPPREYLSYAVIYFVWGLGMHHFGDAVRIARFANWWQVITCYLLYMVPISLVLRKEHWLMQYVFGVVLMAPLEFAGYAMGTSIAFDANIIETIFGVRNFSLAMVIFFGAYFPLGNLLVAKVLSFSGHSPSQGPYQFDSEQAA